MCIENAGCDIAYFEHHADQRKAAADDHDDGLFEISKINA